MPDSGEGDFARSTGPVAPVLGRLIRSRLHPWLPQLVVAVFAGFLAYLAFTPVRHAEFNVAAGVLWKLWWPGLALLVLVAGPIWCAVCPGGAAADLAEKSRARRGARRHAPPRWLRRWGPAVGTATVVAAGIGFLAFGLESSAMWAGVFLLGIPAVAFAFSLRGSGRPFCRYVCPVGTMVRTYSSLSLLGLRPGEKDRLSPGICPAGEAPTRLAPFSRCYLCGACTKEAGGPVPSFALPRRYWRGRMSVWDARVVAILLGLAVADLVRMTPLHPAYVRRLYPILGSFEAATALGALAVTAVVAGGVLLAARSMAGRTGAAAGAGTSLARTLTPLAFGTFVVLGLQHIWGTGGAVVRAVLLEVGALTGFGHLPPSTTYTVVPVLKVLQFAILGAAVVLAARSARASAAVALNGPGRNAPAPGTRGAGGSGAVLMFAPAAITVVLASLIALPMSSAC
ncbi:MAG: 4Fe-4S binding protein [Actinomycetota bacterium]